MLTPSRLIVRLAPGYEEPLLDSRAGRVVWVQASPSKSILAAFECEHGRYPRSRAKHGMDEVANDLRKACHFTSNVKVEKWAYPKEK